MTQNSAFLRLSSTLNYFNHSLKGSEKLNGEVLRTIQEYLNNPQVRCLDGEDDESMQDVLQHLEKLREPIVLQRVSSMTINKINQQLQDVEQLIEENSSDMLGDAFFVIANIEASFLQILSKENSQEQKANQEEAVKLWPDAFYLDVQQRLISELMNAALFNIIQYFQKKKLDFIEYLTEEFLQSLNENISNPNDEFEDNLRKDVLSLLLKTSKDCQIPMSDLIYHLQYAIIGLGERMNQFTHPLQEYIRETNSATLAGFNKTLLSSWTLTEEEVDLFNGLFRLYRKILLNLPEQISDDLSSPSLEKISQWELKEHLEDELHLKCVWIQSDVEKYYSAFKTIIKPASDTQCTAEEFLTEDWTNKRIFLCLSATNAHVLLPQIHNKLKLHRVYVLCNDKSEENQFLQDDQAFGKIRLVTSDEQTFIQYLTVDIVPSIVEIGDLHLKEKQKDNARRWFRSAETKVTKHDKSNENEWIKMIKEKLEHCKR